MHLDPLAPACYLEGTIDAYYLLGRYDDAIEAYKKWDNPRAHAAAYIAASFAMKGQMDECDRYARMFIKNCPDSFSMEEFMSAMDRYFRRDEDRAHWRDGFERAGLLRTR